MTRLIKIFKYFSLTFLTTLIFFSSVEGLFRLFHLFPSKEFFIETKDEKDRVWAQYKLGPIKPKFLKRKNKETFRIFSFGGSTTAGSPYYPRSSFSRMLEFGLKKSVQDKDIELINLGVKGMNSLEVLYCLKESLEYKPDLVILYTGQNEFFRVSIFRDWRHPHINSFIDFLRSHSRIYQALRKANRILIYVPSATGIKKEKNKELGYYVDELPIEMQPMSADFKSDRLKSYQYHLELISEILKNKNIPLVICTTAVNLRDWPPEWRPFPENIPKEELENFKHDLYKAYLAVADKKLDLAEELLVKAEKLAPDYAMCHFVRGWLEEKRGKYDLAREHFLLARKFDNNRYRASPEINQIISEVSRKYQLVMVDVEKLFFEHATTTPGFDLFEDHCHPNLMGQRLIAEEIFRTIVASDLVKLNFKPIEFPSLDEFKLAFNLDQDFLLTVKFNLAVYYMLKCRLPERQARTFKLLKEVIDELPDSIFPRVCLALLLLGEQSEKEAMKVLEEIFHRQGVAEKTRKLLDTYFAPNVKLEGNFLLVRFNTAPDVPILRNIIKLPKNKKRTVNILPLSEYSWIFRYDPEGRRIEDITSLAQRAGRLPKE